MKHFITIFALFVCLAHAAGQTISPPGGSGSATTLNKFNGPVKTPVIVTGRDTAQVRATWAKFPPHTCDTGSIVVLNGYLFYYTGSNWVTPASGGGVQYGDSNVVFITPYFLTTQLLHKLNYSDTASMLSHYLRNNLGVKYTDTASMLAGYIRLITFMDSIAAIRISLGLKINYSDTGNMLNPYLRKVDTGSLSNRINKKVNTIDSNIDGGYESWDYGVSTYFRKDSAAKKVNNSDTAAMLNHYLRSSVAALTYQPIGSYITLGSLSATSPIGYNNTTGVISLGTTGTAGSYGGNGLYSTVTTDAYGRVSGISTGTATISYSNVLNTPTGLPPTGLATGDLSGSYPNPTVNQIQGKSIATLSTGLFKYNGTSWVFDASAYITGNQNITLSGDISGSGTTAITGTLATVNSNVGSFGGVGKYASVTVNAKGLVTGISEGTQVITYTNITGTPNLANYTTTTTTISINGTSQDLSTNRTWNVGTVTKDSAGYGVLGGNVTTTGYKAVDTTLIVAFTDSLKGNGIATKSNLSLYALISSLSSYVKYTDTGSMLSPYLRTNVASATYQPIGSYALQATTITINGVSQSLAAARTYTVTDASLSTSNVTTNNATTSKHGFLPLLSGTSTQYLGGDGNWTTPAGTQYSAGTGLGLNGSNVFSVTPVQTITTLSNLTTNGVVKVSGGVGTLGSALLVNADVSSSAAIAYSKLNLASSIAVTDINATGTPSSTTFHRGDGSWAAATNLSYEVQTTTYTTTTSMTPNTAYTSINSPVAVYITAQSGNITMNNPTGTWANGQGLTIRITCTGSTTTTITYGGSYNNAGTDVPSIATTQANKTTYEYWEYNSLNSKWDLLYAISSIPN